VLNTSSGESWSSVEQNNDKDRRQAEWVKIKKGA
jgi:hypothetical protein